MNTEMLYERLEHFEDAKTVLERAVVAKTNLRYSGYSRAFRDDSDRGYLLLAKMRKVYDGLDSFEDAIDFINDRIEDLEEKIEDAERASALGFELIGTYRGRLIYAATT